MDAVAQLTLCALMPLGGGFAIALGVWTALMQALGKW